MSLVLAPKFHFESFLKSIERYRMTHLTFVVRYRTSPTASNHRILQNRSAPSGLTLQGLSPNRFDRNQLMARIVAPGSEELFPF